MNDNALGELDRILADDEDLQPMTGFSTRVMRAVRSEAAAPPPLAFPWARFLPGVLLNLVLLLGAAVWMLIDPGSSSGAPFPPAWLADPQAQGLLAAGLTLVGSGLLAWVTMSWAAPRRVSSF